MPRKKVRQEKTRGYLENLLDGAGLTDKELAKAIAAGVKSDNSTERTKAVEIAAKWKGFADVDKKVGEEIERLPIGNITLQDLDCLINRCSSCKHGAYEPLRKNADLAAPGIPDPAKAAGNPGMNPPTPKTSDKEGPEREPDTEETPS